MLIHGWINRDRWYHICWVIFVSRGVYNAAIDALSLQKCPIWPTDWFLYRIQFLHIVPLNIINVISHPTMIYFIAHFPHKRAATNQWTGLNLWIYFVVCISFSDKQALNNTIWHSSKTSTTPTTHNIIMMCNLGPVDTIVEPPEICFGPKFDEITFTCNISFRGRSLLIFYTG